MKPCCLGYQEERPVVVQIIVAVGIGIIIQIIHEQSPPQQPFALLLIISYQPFVTTPSHEMRKLPHFGAEMKQFLHFTHHPFLAVEVEFYDHSLSPKSAGKRQLSNPRTLGRQRSRCFSVRKMTVAEGRVAQAFIKSCTR